MDAAAKEFTEKMATMIEEHGAKTRSKLLAGVRDLVLTMDTHPDANSEFQRGFNKAKDLVMEVIDKAEQAVNQVPSA